MDTEPPTENPKGEPTTEGNKSKNRSQANKSPKRGAQPPKSRLSAKELTLIWKTVVGTLTLCGMFAVPIAVWILRAKEEQQKILEHRLVQKDDQIAEYRRQLGLVNKNVTTYTLMSNKDLKERTTNLVAQMRLSFNSYKDSQQKPVQFAQQVAEAWKTNSELFHKLWVQDSEERSRLSAEFQRKFNDDFRADAIILRDEIYARLPKSTHDSRSFDLYDTTVASLDLPIVINDLERLEKLLPAVPKAN